MEALNTESVLVRFGEIGSKKGHVRSEMSEMLRARVEEKLESLDLSYSKVSRIQGRIIIREVQNAEKIAEIISWLPGVSSTSPCVTKGVDKDDFFSTIRDIELSNCSFGVRCNVSTDKFSGSGLEEEIGSMVLEENEGLSVDLDDPDVWVNVEVREIESFVFVETIEGVDGLPVGSQDKLGMCLSGGIDSPVAAFLTMKWGSNIYPIYFYNKPLSAEDHKLRLEEVINKLEEFHPGKDWSYILVDFEKINDILLNQVNRGRMVIHRILMFKVAEKICEQIGLDGFVTGESVGQKSSQTVSNLCFTSSKINSTIFRPLTGYNKNEVIDLAKDIGTFDLSTVDSACRSLSPEKPLTKAPKYEYEEFCKDHDVEELVRSAVEKSKVVDI